MVQIPLPQSLNLVASTTVAEDLNVDNTGLIHV
jgi:hypothetical protein